ncbi:MAG: hypothetical protein NC203_03285 [Firmicutes bacterium]|nr:hypothetical protein [[Eubacterium] siraeum]MCM1487368.1 hypothetical protein [Bacillota bacterium]
MYLDPSINILNVILANKWVAVGLAVMYVGLIAADIFRRHLLSKGAVYYITVFLAPAAMYSAVAGAFMGFAEAQGAKGETALFVIIGVVLFLLSAAVYIRGHIYPTEKNRNYNGQEKLIGAKRLIITGMPSAVIYFVFSVIQLVIAVQWFIEFGGPLASEGLIKLLQNLVGLILLLFIPLANIVVIAVLVLIGGQFLIWGAMLLMAFMQCLLVTNGCIRYTLTENKSKAEKVLFVILALIPAVNFILGIRYLIKISETLKERKGA